MKTDLTKSDSRSLATLFDLRTKTEPAWSPDDLAGMLQHQLDAPLEFDLSTTNDKTAGKLQTVYATQTNAPRTFRELFSHPKPPVALLKSVKDFAKKHRNDPDSPIPKEIATILYFASVAIASTRCRQRITTLTGDQLRDGVKWAIAQPWVNEATRSLFQESLRRIESE